MIKILINKKDEKDWWTEEEIDGFSDIKSHYVQVYFHYQSPTPGRELATTAPEIHRSTNVTNPSHLIYSLIIDLISKTLDFSSNFHRRCATVRLPVINYAF
jgi:hypothetical protein